MKFLKGKNLLILLYDVFNDVRDNTTEHFQLQVLNGNNDKRTNLFVHFLFYFILFYFIFLFLFHYKDKKVTEITKITIISYTQYISYNSRAIAAVH